MKKKLIFTSLFLLATAVVLFGIAFCVPDPAENLPWPIGERAEDIPNRSDLFLQLESVSSTGTTYLLVNHLDEPVEYGCDFYLQIQLEGVWYEIDLELEFTAEGYDTPAHSQTRLTSDWTIHYGELPTGTYRLVKALFLPNPQPVLTYTERETMLVTFAFTI